MARRLGHKDNHTKGLYNHSWSKMIKLPSRTYHNHEEEQGGHSWEKDVRSYIKTGKPLCNITTRETRA